jgi:hypothetical protein
MMTAAVTNGEAIMERDETLDVGDVLSATEVTAWLMTADRPDVSGMSHYRENLLEHVFIAEVLQACARRRRKVEVLRAEVDDAGYDLVLESNGVIRHIQLKSRSGKNRNPLVVNENLQEHVGGLRGSDGLAPGPRGADQHALPLVGRKPRRDDGKAA